MKKAPAPETQKTDTKKRKLDLNPKKPKKAKRKDDKSGKPASGPAETVVVKFRFKQPPKRKRADSELSIDLEDLESHPYQPCTPVKKVKSDKPSKEKPSKEKEKKNLAAKNPKPRQ